MGRDHVVAFYEDEEFLVETVTRFLGPALDAGDAVIVVATPAHRAAFEVALRDAGIDVAAAGAAGCFQSLDAAALVDAFTVDEQLDAERFRSLVGDLIAVAAGGGRRVRIYGEMVALLWDGATGDAMALEDLWNGLATTHAFALLCAYPMRAFADPSSAAVFRRICAKHTTVIPCKGYSLGDSADGRRRAVAVLQQEAAALRAAAARRWAAPDDPGGQPHSPADRASGDRVRPPDGSHFVRMNADQRISARNRAAADRDQAAADRDQTASDRDQSQADADQRTSDRDQAAADRDQAAADRDQTASDRDQSQADADQRTSNRDLAAADREHAAADRDQSQADVDQRTSLRERAAAGADLDVDHGDRTDSDRVESQARADQRSSDRGQAAADRDHTASDRDQTQAEADQRISNRDRAADDRERAADDRDRTAADSDQTQAEADQRTSDRGQAGLEREQAAADREEAAADRAAATRDREEARAELRHAQLDQLTGALGRELGMVALEREINRARRGNGRLALAYVDVDGLKLVNDGEGHAAGDALLQDVVGAIQQHLRPYDPIVRVGGDEFVCVLGDSTRDEARARFRQIGDAIERTQPAGSISVGFAALRPEDTLEELTLRGDLALYEAKHAR